MSNASLIAYSSEEKTQHGWGGAGMNCVPMICVILLI